MSESIFPFPNQIPTPPHMAEMPAVDDVYSIVLIIMQVLFTIWTLYDWKKTGSPMPFLILIGGTLCFFQEPLMDHVGAVWWPQYGQSVSVIRAFNVTCPLWVIPGYGMYVGALAALVYRRMNTTGMTVKHLWIAYIAIWVCSFTLELPGLNMGSYYYYGDQPFKIFGFPLTWVMSNGTIIMLSAAVITGFKDFFKGWKLLLVPLVVTMCNGAAQCANGHPIWVAMNSHAGPFVRYFASILTFFFCHLMVHFISLKVCVSQAEYEKRKAER